MVTAALTSAKLRGAAIASAVLVAGLGLLFHVQVAARGAELQTNPKDSRHLHSIVEWGHLCLSRDSSCAGLWDPPIFAPEHGVAARSDTLLGLLPFYTPMRWLGASAIASWQWLAVILATLNYVTAWRLLRATVATGPLATSLGAALFAFAAPRAAKLNHPHLSAQFPSLLAALLLVWATRPESPTGRARACAFALPVLIAYQAWCSIYLAWLTMFVGALVLLAMLFDAGHRARARAFLSRAGWAVIAGGLVAGVAVLPLWHQYSADAIETSAATYAAVLDYLPRPDSWLDPGVGAWFDWGLTDIIRAPGGGLESAHRLGWGLVAPAIALLGVWRSRRHASLRAICLGAVVSVALATCWPGGFSGWSWVYQLVPGAPAIRAVGRIVLVLLLPAAMFFAVGVEFVLSRGRLTAIAALLALLVAEQGRSMPAYPRARFDSVALAIADALPPDCAAFFVSFQGTDPPAVAQLDAVWAALLTRTPTVNGYAGYAPPAWMPLAEPYDRTEAERRHLTAALGDWLREHQVPAEQVCWLTESARRNGEPRRFVRLDESVWPRRARAGGAPGDS